MAFGRILLVRARALEPGAFAAVMATGIVSIDASQHGMVLPAQALFVVSLVMFACLCALGALRALRFRGELLADFVDPVRGVGFLTFAAAACVLATQCIVVVRAPLAAVVLGAVGAVAWVVLAYAFFAAMIARRAKRGLARSIHGGWLVLVVTTQAVAVVAIELSGAVGAADQAQRPLLFAGLCLYLIGAALYLPVITLVVHRMVFLPMRARDFTPPYWINMGALAITTLAGSLFVLHAPAAGPLAGLVAFVKGCTLLAWAVASAWVPLLLLLELWRHVWRHVPVRYETDDWDIVFPIGMYTVGTFELAHALDLDLLLAIPAAGVYVSLLAWAIVAAAWLARAARGGRRADARALEK